MFLQVLVLTCLFLKDALFRPLNYRMSFEILSYLGGERQSHVSGKKKRKRKRIQQGVTTNARPDNVSINYGC